MNIGSERFLGLLIATLITEFPNSKWHIQHGKHNFKLLIELHENGYLGVFEITDSEFDNKIHKLRMEDPIW